MICPVCKGCGKEKEKKIFIIKECEICQETGYIVDNNHKIYDSNQDITSTRDLERI